MAGTAEQLPPCCWKSSPYGSALPVILSERLPLQAGPVAMIPRGPTRPYCPYRFPLELQLPGHCASRGRSRVALFCPFPHTSNMSFRLLERSPSPVERVHYRGGRAESLRIHTCLVAARSGRWANPLPCAAIDWNYRATSSFASL